MKIDNKKMNPDLEQSILMDEIYQCFGEDLHISLLHLVQNIYKFTALGDVLAWFRSWLIFFSGFSVRGSLSYLWDIFSFRSIDGVKVDREKEE